MIDETALRTIIFFTVLIIMVVLEICYPARKVPVTQQKRLIGNFSLIIISGFMSRVVLPIGLAGFALYCVEQQWGLFNVLDLPTWLSIPISILLLDMIVYWQHRLFHKVPILWRLHKVHHADAHVDSSTALRFHPIEIIASIGVKATAVFILGVPAIAVILFEVLLNGFAIFNHANIRLPKTMEKLIRPVLVTQVLHRIHHSQLYKESNCNFGFSVIWWDRLFGSYADSATKSDAEIDIGLTEYPDAKDNAHLWGLLAMPFKRK